MGMRYEDFWYNYTLREFWNAVEGFFEGEERRMKDGWEQTRTLYTGIVNQYAKRPQRGDKLLPFPWDENSTSADKETIERLKQHMEEENKKISDGN